MKSLDELKKIRDEMAEEMKMREDDDDFTRVRVGMSTCGIAAGARDTLDAIMEEVNKRQLSNINVTTTGCAGFCKNEPLVDVISPDGTVYTYQNVDEERAKAIVAQHLVNKKPVMDWLMGSRVSS